MRFSASGYLLGETGKSIWRNKLTSFLSCATTALSLFLLGVAFLIRLNTNLVFNVAQSEMEIRAYLKAEVTDAEGQAIQSQVKDIAGVALSEYISREDALEELRAMFLDKQTVIEGLGEDNPLPASIRVKAAEVADIPSIVAELELLPAFDDVEYPEETSRRLAALGVASQYVSLGGMLVVGLVAVMVIGNSIRLTIDSRRHEIAIMKLVGATDGFIIGPFILEGMILGMSGGLLGEGLVVGLYAWIVGTVTGALPFIPIMSLTTNMTLNMLGIMLATGVAVGTLGSVLALRKHLRV